MKTVILCGGLGSRLSEETKIKPKPMVEIGKIPIVMHIIKSFQQYGYNKFLLATGYKHEIIEKYFSRLNDERLQVSCIYTGKKTNTAGRILKLKKYLIKDKNFFLTYGDGLSDINIEKLYKFHLRHRKIATLSAVRPPVRFGELILKKNKVYNFLEKQQTSKGWINGGFFVFKKNIFEYLNNYSMLEKEPINKLVTNDQLMAYKHLGFWQCMDTLRDKNVLEKIWKNKNVPWLYDKKIL